MPGLMAHGAGHVADPEQPDLPFVDARERVRDERVEARLVDLDVEHTGASGRYEGSLDVALVPAEVSVDPGPVEQRADDVEVGVQRRAGVDDPEADRLAR